MSYQDKPRPCSCFNGYCYRSLCAERIEERARKAKVEPKRERRPQILTWHKDLSGEENGQ